MENILHLGLVCNQEDLTFILFCCVYYLFKKN